MTEPFTPDPNAEDLDETGKPVPPVKRGPGRPRKPRAERVFNRYTETEEDRKQRNLLALVVSKGGFDEGFEQEPPTPEQKFVVTCMVFSGMTHEGIADCLGTSVWHLNRMFRHELDNGTNLMITDIAVSLAQRAKAGSDTAAIFLLKTRGRGAFSENKATGVDAIAEQAEALEIDDKKVLIDKILEALKPKVIEPVKEEAKP